MAITVSLRGYPEAVLAADTVTFDLPNATAMDTLVRSLAGSSSRLAEALLHRDGTPRQTTKVLVDGTVTSGATLSDHKAVTILASLPCDG